jgi:hypothetical protein
MGSPILAGRLLPARGCDLGRPAQRQLSGVSAPNIEPRQAARRDMQRAWIAALDNTCTFYDV